MHVNSIDQFIGVGYRKLEQTSCNQLIDPVIMASTLASAKGNCTRDSRCMGVLDIGCDGGNFYLCDAASFYLPMAKSCVYDKQGKS